MAKFTDDSVLDAALDKTETSILLTVCEGQPLNYTEATTPKGSGGKSLGQVAVDGSDFTKAPGDVSGRKTTVAAQSGISATDSGNADHVALCDATTLLHATTAPTQAVSAGGTIDVAAFDVEFQDPA